VNAGMAAAATQIATAAASLGWMFAEWLIAKKPSVLGMISGAVAGLVAITPASGFVDAQGALIIGYPGRNRLLLLRRVVKRWIVTTTLWMHGACTASAVRLGHS